MVWIDGVADVGLVLLFGSATIVVLHRADTNGPSRHVNFSAQGADSVSIAVAGVLTRGVGQEGAAGDDDLAADVPAEASLANGIAMVG